MIRPERLGLAAQASFELVRLLVNGPRLPGWSLGIATFASLTAIVVLAVAAAGLALRRSFGWGAGVFGALWGMTYALMLLAVHEKLGVIHLALAVALLFLLGKCVAVYRTVLPSGSAA